MTNDNELEGISRLFFDDEPAAFATISTGRGGSDFRETVIVDTAEGGRYVIKLADNDFTFSERIKMWQRTAEEYTALGYYCPRIYCDKTGGFPFVEYEGRRYTAYAEEYSRYKTLERRDGSGSSDADFGRYRKDIWSMTARIAAKRLDFTEYPSAYCLFETFCPSDKTDEVLENALEWKRCADALPGEFAEQADRIWQLWTENRTALERVYHQLPTSVFQADLNPSNILIDENGGFAGVCDFNLSGRDVFLNYLMRENFGDPDREIAMIREALMISSGYYAFSDIEKNAALMLYRCLKPLWYNRVEQLRECGSDSGRIKAFLDKTERYLTAGIDFRTYMERK